MFSSYCRRTSSGASALRLLLARSSTAKVPSSRTFPSGRCRTLATTHLVGGSTCRSTGRVPVVGWYDNNNIITTNKEHGRIVQHHRQQYKQQQIRSIFIQQLDTPNPESIKFVPSGKIVLDTTDDDTVNGYYVTKNDPNNDILRSPLAKELFQIVGIKAVYLGSDFVTITKYAEYKWKLLRPQILDKLMTFFDQGTPALLDAPEITDTTILDDDDEVVAMIKELIESRIRPAVQEDGGDIRYVGFDFETGVVTVQLAGSCVGCPSSSITLKQGVENMLMHYIPEVKTVVALEEEEGEEGEAPTVEKNDGENKKQKSYEERLAAAGIPFSD